jgi:hypothetical protein
MGEDIGSNGSLKSLVREGTSSILMLKIEEERQLDQEYTNDGPESMMMTRPLEIDRWTGLHRQETR